MYVTHQVRGSGCLTTLRFCCRVCGGAAQSFDPIIPRAAPPRLHPASSKRVLGARQNRDLFHQASPKPVPLDLKIETRLQIEPKPLGRTEVAGQP